MADNGVIGFIGLGIMGKPMASHLITAGYELVVHEVNREPVKDLVSKGAREASSPKEVAEQAGFITGAIIDINGGMFMG